MKSILTLALVATLAIFAQNVKAQDDPPATEKELEEVQDQLDYLKSKKQFIIDEEKLLLKKRVIFLNKQVKEGKLTQEEADQKKQEFAEKTALNIENKTAIVNNQIALVERNGSITSNGTQILFGIGHQDGDGKRIFGITVDDGKVTNPERQYDRRTYSELVLSFGLNNALTEVSDIGDDFSVGRSRFFELGLAWKTRVFKNSGALHLKYGASLQINKLFAKDNQTLVINDNDAIFQEFPIDLDKSQLRFTNLVVPVHLEFGGWRKEQLEDAVRYRLAGKFRMGIGGYVGVRLGTQQKLKYKEDGERVKIKEKQDFGGDTFVYGLSSYIRITGDLSLYGKYDLSSAFNTQNLGDVNNVSLGVRWDW